ncbi:hypothetical protein D1007_02611 [Hordeum vulgare]|nr:hypothetical protein D1007_02611 [Hordeum vulgare]
MDAMDNGPDMGIDGVSLKPQRTKQPVHVNVKVRVLPYQAMLVDGAEEQMERQDIEMQIRWKGLTLKNCRAIKPTKEPAAKKLKKAPVEKAPKILKSAMDDVLCSASSSVVVDNANEEALEVVQSMARETSAFVHNDINFSTCDVQPNVLSISDVSESNEQCGSLVVVDIEPPIDWSQIEIAPPNEDEVDVPITEENMKRKQRARTYHVEDDEPGPQFGVAPIGTPNRQTGGVPVGTPNRQMFTIPASLLDSPGPVTRRMLAMALADESSEPIEDHVPTEMPSASRARKLTPKRKRM